MALSIPFSSPSWLLLLPHCVLSVFLNPSGPDIFDDQIKRAAITRQIADAIEEAWTFEKWTWTTGPLQTDLFYQAPATSLSAGTRSLLKVEEATDTARYTIPPVTALSCFPIESRALNGAAVPASPSCRGLMAPEKRVETKSLLQLGHTARVDYLPTTGLRL